MVYFICETGSTFISQFDGPSHPRFLNLDLFLLFGVKQILYFSISLLFIRTPDARRLRGLKKARKTCEHSGKSGLCAICRSP